MRTRAERRFYRAKTIRRKKRIIKEHGDYWSYSHDGLLNKGKIHCSCSMCKYIRKYISSAKKRTERLKFLEEIREYFNKE
jgi:hypothetical protein